VFARVSTRSEYDKELERPEKKISIHQKHNPVLVLTVIAIATPMNNMKMPKEMGTVLGSLLN
jgi:hypothetical protein